MDRQAASVGRETNPVNRFHLPTLSALPAGKIEMYLKTEIFTAARSIFQFLIANEQITYPASDSFPHIHVRHTEVRAQGDAFKREARSATNNNMAE